MEDTKIIHIGERYKITTDGSRAFKTDGENTRSMDYCEKRDTSALAGAIDEKTAWQIIRDIARQKDRDFMRGGAYMREVTTPISPEHILIYDNLNSELSMEFQLSPWSESHDQKYTAPEGYSDVWALAATIFYLYLGCHVFQGLGGKGQSPNTPIPTLRKELPELSELLVRCLYFDPKKRPEIMEVANIAGRNLERLSKTDNLPKRKLKHKQNQQSIIDDIDILWPEEIDKIPN